jgi:hypothetical protein
MAYGIHWGAHIKKISGSWEKSVAAAGTGKDGQLKDTANAEDGAGDSGGGYIIKEHFGDGLLYACYEFYDRFKHKPKDWLELFDFFRFMKVKSIMRDIAVQEAKAGGRDG